MSGLDGVVVGSTRLSKVDGAAGQLWIGGRRVEDLSGSTSFEAMLARLFEGGEPGVSDEATWRRELGAARAAVYPALAPALEPEPADPMDALRARVARLTIPGDPRTQALRHVAAVGVALGVWARRRAGEAPIEPDPARSHAADLLRMARGAAPTLAETAALDGYLVTVIDHGMNASTFAARVVASTGSDLTSAVVAAIGALKGPLHGGAPGPVLDMLDGCEDRGDHRAWLEAELAAGRRIMGMGHRVYRVRDPRASALEKVLSAFQAGAEAPGTPERAVDTRRAEGPSGAQAGRRGPDPGGPDPGGRLELARAVEREAEALLAARYPDRPLRANVEFYTAVLLEALGIPRTWFSALFACSRVAGWCAHVEEQRAEGRLLRPRVGYHGPVPSGVDAGTGGISPETGEPDPGRTAVDPRDSELRSGA